MACPRCEDPESGIGNGQCAFSPADSLLDVTEVRSLGSAWSNDSFVVGLRTPMADFTSYTVVCVCTNGANLLTKSRTNNITTDFTPPQCSLTGSYQLTVASTIMPRVSCFLCLLGCVLGWLCACLVVCLVVCVVMVSLLLGPTW